MIAALPATYAARLVIARTPATEAMLTMAPPPPVEHRGDLVLHPEEGAAHVGADAAVELVGIEVGQRRRHRAVGGVVERRVEPAEGARPRASTSARIESASPTSVTAATARPPRRSISSATPASASCVAGAEHDGVAVPGERPGGVGADAAAGPGDQGDPAGRGLLLLVLVVMRSSLPKD